MSLWQNPQGETGGGGGEGGSTNWNDIKGKPDSFKPSPHKHEIEEIVNLEDSLSEIAVYLLGKVDKVEGKELSDNNFTNEEKAFLESIKEVDINNLVVSVNGKTGEVIITKVDLDLDKVTNDKQATEIDFLEHRNNQSIHLTTEQLAFLTNTPEELISINSKIDFLVENKVDKKAGYGLSKNDFTDTDKQKLDTLAETKYIKTINNELPDENSNIDIDKNTVGLNNVDNVQQASKTEFTSHVTNQSIHLTQTQALEIDKVKDKVDSVIGMGLSSNDFTNQHKAKLDSLPSDFTQGITSINLRNADENGNINLSSADVQLEFVKNVEQATKVEFNTHVNDKRVHLDDSQITSISKIPQMDIDLKNKVDKDGDKVLSDNNFTDTLKEKLDNLVEIDYDHPVISVNGKTGLVELDKTDVQLDKVLNEEQATKVEFNYLESDVISNTSKVNNLTTAVQNKVDKETGKGLSSNDFTNELKDKLENIPEVPVEGLVTSVNEKTGAVVLNKEDIGLNNVDNIKQATKAEHDILKGTVESIEDDLLNKVDKDGDKVLSTNDFTNFYKDKIDNLPISGNEVNSVNGKTGEVVLDKSDIGLNNVVDELQATKVEFDAHTTDEDVHLTPPRLDNINKIPSLESNVGDLDTMVHSYDSRIISNKNEIDRILTLIGEGTDEGVNPNGILEVIVEGHLYAIGDVIYDIQNHNTVRGSLAKRFVKDNLELFQDDKFTYNRIYMNTMGINSATISLLNNNDEFYQDMLKGLFDKNKDVQTVLNIKGKEEFNNTIQTVFVDNEFYFTLDNKMIEEYFSSEDMAIGLYTSSIATKFVMNIDYNGDFDLPVISMTYNSVVSNNKFIFDEYVEYKMDFEMNYHYQDNIINPEDIQYYFPELNMSKNNIHISEDTTLSKIVYHNPNATLIQSDLFMKREVDNPEYNSGVYDAVLCYAIFMNNDINKEITRRIDTDFVYFADRMKKPNYPILDNINTEHYLNQEIKLRPSVSFQKQDTLTKELKASETTPLEGSYIRNIHVGTDAPTDTNAIWFKIE